MTTSRQVKLDAIRTLCDLAGWPNADVDLVAARSTSLAVAYRQALRAAHPDQAQLDRIRRLYAVARGRADALDDAIHDLTDLTEPVRPEVPDLDALDDALRRLKEQTA